MLRACVEVDAPGARASRGLQRVATALRRYAPRGVECAPAGEAALVVLHVVGRNAQALRKAQALLAAGRRYAVVQYCVRSTRNPSTRDWLPLWREAVVTWSYYDLARLCREDGERFQGQAYLAPLGADASVFRLGSGAPRRYLVATVGPDWLSESVRECALAAREAEGLAIHVGPPLARAEVVEDVTDITDAELARVYCASAYVSGLRRVEGFELPAAEGLLCGARPIMFDRPHYRLWYDGFARFIPEAPRADVLASLARLFRDPVEPISKRLRAAAAKAFDWDLVVRGFWERCQ